MEKVSRHLSAAMLIVFILLFGLGLLLGVCRPDHLSYPAAFLGGVLLLGLFVLWQRRRGDKPSLWKKLGEGRSLALLLALCFLLNLAWALFFRLEPTVDFATFWSTARALAGEDVVMLKDENAQKTETIGSQDKELHTAWYVFGTKRELKEQNILKSGEVLQGNFNKNYFTKIDIRVDKEIKLMSRDARILTNHPAGTYTLERDANKQYVLRITNPQQFWSTSKYLVVQVK